MHVYLQFCVWHRLARRLRTAPMMQHQSKTQSHSKINRLRLRRASYYGTVGDVLYEPFMVTPLLSILRPVSKKRNILSDVDTVRLWLRVY